MGRLSALSRHLAPPATADAPFERAALSAAELRELSLRGWSRCEADLAQLRYLAAAMAARGEPVDVESLHKEGLSQGVQLLKNGANPYYRNMLLSPHADRDWLLGSCSKRLAAATNPPALRNPDAPVLWGADEWQAMQRRQAEEDIFDWHKVLEQFDREQCALVAATTLGCSLSGLLCDLLSPSTALPMLHS
eukprot:COSAG05_NODE_2210_length_3386_cov_14.118508_2_plen_192_part_00